MSGSGEAHSNNPKGNRSVARDLISYRFSRWNVEAALLVGEQVIAPVAV